MKKLIFAAALLACCLLIKSAEAQVRVSASVNIGNQPGWGPVGYRHVQYYYLPDIDAYYDVSAHQYVYNENNQWVHARVLPPRYSTFDRYHSYKVVINQDNPWDRDDDIRVKYAGYKGRHDQVVIRDSRDTRYRNHWKDDDDDRKDHDR